MSPFQGFPVSGGSLIGASPQSLVCDPFGVKPHSSSLTIAIIYNWLRNRNTIEFLGIGEKVNNPDFNSPEFEGFIRDYSNLEQLVVLTNVEHINSVLIRQALPQVERLIKLNEIAITQ
jgi:hypothetical protein